MSTELEQRLRAQMEQFTAGVPVPPGLARRACRHVRRQRITTRAVGAAVAAAAVAGAAVAAVGASGTPGSGDAQTTAYVVSHTEKALDSAATADDIVVIRTADGSQEMWFYAGPHGRVERSEVFTPAGQPEVVSVDTRTATTLSTLVVEYDARMWWEQTSALPAPRPHPAPPTPSPSCGPVISLAESPADLEATIRTELACGQLTFVGTEYVDGVRAIGLRSQPLYGAEQTWWVDPSTYLPVRVQLERVSAPDQAFDANDLQWLPPTAANLTVYSVRVPPGFTRMPAQ